MRFHCDDEYPKKIGQDINTSSGDSSNGLEMVNRLLSEFSFFLLAEVVLDQDFESEKYLQ